MCPKRSCLAPRPGRAQVPARPIHDGLGRGWCPGSKGPVAALGVRPQSQRRAATSSIRFGRIAISGVAVAAKVGNASKNAHEMEPARTGPRSAIVLSCLTGTFGLIPRSAPVKFTCRLAFLGPRAGSVRILLTDGYKKPQSYTKMLVTREGKGALVRILPVTSPDAFVRPAFVASFSERVASAWMAAAVTRVRGIDCDARWTSTRRVSRSPPRERDRTGE